MCARPWSDLFALAIAVIAACGTTDSINDGPLVQVAQTTSASGAYDVAVFAHTPTLTRGNYSLQYVLTDGADGTPVDSLTMTIVPWMPAMGHGTAITPIVTELGNGTYEIDNVDLFMAGLWQLRTTTTAESTDKVEPALQIE